MAPRHEGGISGAVSQRLRPSVRTALKEARHRLEVMYGDRLVHVTLYGSQARGEAREDSDVDVLVILRDDYELYPEFKRLSPLSLDLLERYGVYVSLQPFSEEEYRERQSPLMINVRKEGVELL